MRRGEILGQRWRDVDLDAARLSVTTGSRGSRVRGHRLDAEESQRSRDRPRRRDGGTASCAQTAAAGRTAEMGPEYGDRDLVATHANGSPIHRHSFSQTFTQLVSRAGIRPIRLHDLRHTHATLALKAGVPVKVVSERLDHESPAFTLKQYARVIPGVQAAAAVWWPSPSASTQHPLETPLDRSGLRRRSTSPAGRPTRPQRFEPPRTAPPASAPEGAT